MSLALNGKSALITAASEGLGFASAVKIASEGARVAICGRDPDKLEIARRSIDTAAGREGTIALRADLRRPMALDDLFRRALERLGKLDILVVNTGHMAYGTLETLEDSDWYDAMELVLMSAVRLARLAVAEMRQQGAGDIVFITAAGMKEPAPHLVLSDTMRAGIASLAKTLSRAVAGANIRVNVVAPGYFDTGRVRRRIDEMVAREGMARPEAAKMIAGDVPLGRIGAAEELGELVAFVVSRRVGFLTGSTIVVDGGLSRGVF